MKKLQLAAIVCFTVILVTGLWFNTYGFTGTAGFTLARSGSPLLFAPVAAEKLLVATPGTGLIRVKTIELANVGEQNRVWVHLYRYAADLYSNDIIAFLTDGKKVYSLGMVSINGQRNITVSAIDSNHDGTNEVQISGSFSEGVVNTKIFGLTGQNRWVKWLSCDHLASYDLNQDGREELVAFSPNNRSPYVIIFRWEKDHFEKADVAGSLGSSYATLLLSGSAIAIQVGRQGEDGVRQQLYLYDDGKLFSMKTASIEAR